MMNKMAELEEIENIIEFFAQEDNYPCWSCAETDEYEFKSEQFDLTLTPVINLNNQEVKGLLVHNYSDNSENISYIDGNLLDHFHARFNKNLKNREYSYYSLFLEYFELQLNNENPDPNDYKNLKSYACVRHKGWCVCEIRPESHTGSPCQFPPGTTEGGELDCSQLICPDGGNTENETEIDQGDSSTGGPFHLIYDVHQWDWVFDLYDYPNEIKWPPYTIRNIGDFNTNANSNDDPFANDYDIPSPPEFSLEWFDLIAELLDYLENETSVVLTDEMVDAISDPYNFQLITWPLWNKKEQLTDHRIEVFLSFVSRHAIFIQDIDMAAWLMFTNKFTSELDSWLSNCDPEFKGFGYIMQRMFSSLPLPPVSISQAFTNLDDVIQLTKDNPSVLFSNPEIVWLINNTNELQEVKTNIEEAGGDAIKLAAMQIYVTLGTNNLLDLTVNEISSLSEDDLKIHFQMTRYNLSDRTILAAQIWHQIFTTEAGGGGISAWLDSIKDSIDDFFDSVLVPAAAAIDSYLQSLGIIIPSTLEEWQVFGNILLQVITENAIYFIPYLGDAYEIGQGLQAAVNGESASAALGIIGGLAGILPISQILKKIGTFIDVIKLGFKAWKLIYKVFGQVFRFMNNAADAVVKLASNKVKLLKGTDEVAEIVNDILHVRYAGYGGDVICDSRRTTTCIGNWSGGTGELIETGLSKSGKNPKGINVLNENIPDDWTDERIWLDVNKPWLEAADARGDIIRAVSNPLDNSTLYNANGIRFFGREHEHLTNVLNYTFDPISNTYIK